MMMKAMLNTLPHWKGSTPKLGRSLGCKCNATLLHFWIHLKFAFHCYIATNWKHYTTQYTYLECKIHAFGVFCIYMQFSAYSTALMYIFCCMTSCWSWCIHYNLHLHQIPNTVNKCTPPFGVVSCIFVCITRCNWINVCSPINHKYRMQCNALS